MRFSLATIALVGNALLSVNSAPTSLSHHESPFDIRNGLTGRGFVPPKITGPKNEPVPGISVPKPGTKPNQPDNPATGGSSSRQDQGISEPTGPKIYQPKPFPELGTEPGKYAYTIDRASEQPDIKWGTAFEIRSNEGDNGPSPFLDKIAINTDTDTINIIEAWNRLDRTVRDEQLRVSDFMMILFKQQGKNPTDLKAVHVDAVINKDSDPLFEKIFEALGKSREEDTVTFSANDADKTNFNSIAGTPFGLAIERANQEYSIGKTAQSYTLSPNLESGGSFNDMDVILG